MRRKTRSVRSVRIFAGLIVTAAILYTAAFAVIQDHIGAAIVAGIALVLVCRWTLASTPTRNRQQRLH